MIRNSKLMRGTVAFAMVVALGACGDDDDSTADPGATAGTEAADGETVEIGAIDYEFTNVPATVEAGTTFTLRNEAETELHELVAFRLDDDESRSVEEIAQLSQEEMQGVLGEPSTVILTPPSSDEAIVAIGDGSLDEAGRYAFFCMIPTGVDADEYMAAAATSDGPPDVGEGPPHIVHGMFAEVTVE